MGAAIKKENVTPMGTPAVTKPMKSGTAEQEQNGVTVPSNAASTLPTVSRRPAKMRRVRSAVKNVRITPTPKTTSTSNMRTLGVSYRKKATDSPRRLPLVRPRTSWVSIWDSSGSRL